MTIDISVYMVASVLTQPHCSLLCPHQLDEAAIHLAQIVNDDKYVSPKGKSNHALWVEMATLISENPDKVTSLNTEGDAGAFILKRLFLFFIFYLSIGFPSHPEPDLYEKYESTAKRRRL